jgi:hypothetical protein
MSSASFLYHDHHTITLHGDNTVTCDTCSLPLTVANAVHFMVSNNVYKLIIDGAPLKRVN